MSAIATSFAPLIFASVIASAAVHDECDFIRDGLDHLPSGGGVITIPAGAFICRSKIIIKTDNVIFRGAGEGLATLRLAGLSPSPMLEIGNDKVVLDENGNWVTSTRVTNIEVSDLTIDENLANQDPKKECGNGSCSCDVSNIRNNAITIRGASFVKLNRTHV